MKKLVYLFAMMMTIALSFASCSSDDSNDETENNQIGSTVIDKCENGAVISSNSYYFLSPCCQWGISISDVKDKMAGYELAYENTKEATSTEYETTYLSYNLGEASNPASLLYTFKNGKLNNCMFMPGKLSSLNISEIVKCLISDGLTQKKSETMDDGSLYITFVSPSKKTRASLNEIAGDTPGYIISWRAND